MKSKLIRHFHFSAKAIRNIYNSILLPVGVIGNILSFLVRLTSFLAYWLKLRAYSHQVKVKKDYITIFRICFREWALTNWFLNLFWFDLSKHFPCYSSKIWMTAYYFNATQIIKLNESKQVQSKHMLWNWRISNIRFYSNKESDCLVNT